ncbi:MAG TPA: amidohydrolase family protein [Chloroflexi bacterium]|jgi:dihydroorotase-like cyclic amidohydrolase|nr:amidohydrolase family protein [Chloroflexota bacterium]
MPNLMLPGLVDVHVHLREPGGTHKEDVASGTAAALSGGFVGILDMPNNTPPITDRQTLYQKLGIYRAKAVSDYGLFVGFDGEHVQATVEAAPLAVGLKLYLDETFGDLTTREPARLAEVFEAWPGPGPIAVHAESASMRVALQLAERYGQRLHVCHVSHPDDLFPIDAARQRGVTVTCEVTPHHLFLSDEAVERLGAYAHVKPALVPSELVDLFWQRLHLVDAVASDHAPHTRTEKGEMPRQSTPAALRQKQREPQDPAMGARREASPAPPGLPGLETTLPLFLRAVDEGRLTLERMLELLHDNPLRIYGLQAAADSAVEVDLGTPYRLPFEGYSTRCGWSPFVGQWALGHVVRVRLRGRPVYEDGRVLVAPGYGQPLGRSEQA